MKDCEKLQKWMRSIKNHIYWTAASSTSGPERVAKWTSILRGTCTAKPVKTEPTFRLQITVMKSTTGALRSLREKAVLQNLLMCMVCFYSLYYIVVSLCIGLLRVHEINSLLAPFDYTTQPSWQNPKYLVCVISTEVTYLLGGLVFAWIVEEWVWDYAITVTLLHVAMTVAVMSDFPSAEHWWMALGSGLVMMIFGGQLLAYKLFRSNFVYPAELQNF